MRSKNVNLEDWGTLHLDIDTFIGTPYRETCGDSYPVRAVVHPLFDYFLELRYNHNRTCNSGGVKRNII